MGDPWQGQASRFVGAWLDRFGGEAVSRRALHELFHEEGIDLGPSPTTVGWMLGRLRDQRHGDVFVRVLPDGFQLEHAGHRSLKPGMVTARGGDAERWAVKVRNHEAFLAALGERFGGQPKRSTLNPCVGRLKPPGRCYRNYPNLGQTHRCLPPHTDHPSAWTVKGKTVAFISEPYWLSRETLDGPSEQRDEVVAWAERNGLAVTFSDGSWWNPPGPGEHGGTYLVMFTLADAPGQGG